MQSIIIGSYHTEYNATYSGHKRQPDRTHEMPPSKELTPQQIEARRASSRERYAHMKPEQRQAIRDRQNARYASLRNKTAQLSNEGKRTPHMVHYANMTPEQKHTKKQRITHQRELRRNTPSKKSIAMANPMYIRSDVPVTGSGMNLASSEIVDGCASPGNEGSPMEIQYVSGQRTTGQIPKHAFINNGNVLIYILISPFSNSKWRLMYDTQLALTENSSTHCQTANSVVPPIKPFVTNEGIVSISIYFMIQYIQQHYILILVTICMICQTMTRRSYFKRTWTTMTTCLQAKVLLKLSTKLANIM